MASKEASSTDAAFRWRGAAVRGPTIREAVPGVKRREAWGD
jgi:hypothetical protein